MGGLVARCHEPIPGVLRTTCLAEDDEVCCLYKQRHGATVRKLLSLTLKRRPGLCPLQEVGVAGVEGPVQETDGEELEKEPSECVGSLSVTPEIEGGAGQPLRVVGGSQIKLSRSTPAVALKKPR